MMDPVKAPHSGLLILSYLLPLARGGPEIRKNAEENIMQMDKETMKVQNKILALLLPLLTVSANAPGVAQMDSSWKLLPQINGFL